MSNYNRTESWRSVVNEAIESMPKDLRDELTDLPANAESGDLADRIVLCNGVYPIIDRLGLSAAYAWGFVVEMWMELQERKELAND